MKADALFYASLPHKIIRAMDQGRYMSQCEEFNALVGWGATAAEADADLAQLKLKVCQHMQAQGLRIPAPRHHDEAIYQRVWDAACTSLLAALDAEGVIITGDATGNVLTLAKSIAEKIETASNRPFRSIDDPITPENVNDPIEIDLGTGPNAIVETPEIAAARAKPPKGPAKKATRKKATA